MSVRCSRSCVPSTPTRRPTAAPAPTPRRAGIVRQPAIADRRPKHAAADDPRPTTRPARTSRRPCSTATPRRSPRDAALAETAEDLGAAGQARAPGRAERPPRRPAPPAGQDRRRQGAARRRRPARPVGARAPAGRRHRLLGRRRLGAGGPTASGGGAPGLLTELATAVVTPLRERLGARSSDRRPHAGRHRDRDRPAPRRPVPRVAGQELEGVARRRARRGVRPGRVRRRARRRAVCAGCRRTSGKCPDCDDNALEPTVKGERLPDRAAAPARAPGLPVPARRRRRA